MWLPFCDAVSLALVHIGTSSNDDGGEGEAGGLLRVRVAPGEEDDLTDGEADQFGGGRGWYRSGGAGDVRGPLSLLANHHLAIGSAWHAQGDPLRLVLQNIIFSDLL